MKKYVFITTGGTGGHIFPAIAIAQILEKHTEYSPVFIGSKFGMETKILPQYNFPAHFLPVKGLQRKKILKNIPLLYYVPTSLLQAYRLISKYQPKLVIGVGGYASFPALWIAHQRKIPILLQEQNAYPGLVTRMFAKKAEVVMLGMEYAKKYLPGSKTLYTGNPVRESYRIYPKNEMLKFWNFSENNPVLAIFGGSLGAKTLNEVTKKIVGSSLNFNILWQTGKRYYDEYKSYESPNVKVLPFIQEMDKAYSVADFVISRAGALTVAELFFFKKPSLLIPSPNVAENHQYYNAKEAETKGFAKIFTENDSSTEELAQQILETLENQAEMQALLENASKLPDYKANENIQKTLLKFL